MHILNPSESVQRLYFIPRNTTTVNANTIFYDKQERKSYTRGLYGITHQANGISYISYVDIPDIMKEGRFYGFTINDSETDDVIYKGMIFCTAQTDYDKFDVHKDDYVVEDSYDNEYVIL